MLYHTYRSHGQASLDVKFADLSNVLVSVVITVTIYTTQTILQSNHLLLLKPVEVYQVIYERKVNEVRKTHICVESTVS